MNLAINCASTLIIHADVLYIMGVALVFLDSSMQPELKRDDVDIQSAPLTLARLLKTFWSQTSALFYSV